MKNIKLMLGITLLVLAGCSSFEKKINEEDRIYLPTPGSQQAYEVNISTLKESEFIPQTDIIDPSQNVTLAENRPKEAILNGVDLVNISQKQIRNKIAYNGNSKVPFTGTFAAVVGVLKHYTEDYKDGVLNGNKVWYSEAGRVGLKEAYSNGIKNGPQETYYRNTGNIRSRINYAGGRVSGPATWYDNSGKIIYQEDFRNGSGNWAVYWDNGQVREKGALSGGVATGEWRSYTQKGELEKVTIYKNGSPVSQEWFK